MFLASPSSRGVGLVFHTVRRPLSSRARNGLRLPFPPPFPFLFSFPFPLSFPSGTGRAKPYRRRARHDGGTESGLVARGLGWLLGGGRWR
jgi:hypothetical protein